MKNALILIAEDEPEIARILTAYLERDDYRVVTAQDGELALTHAQTLKPDLVILDVGLPKLDGFEVLGRLRQTSDIPVLMATARVDDLDRLTGLHLGADDYVLKPYNPTEIVARTKAILRRGAFRAERLISFADLAANPVEHVINAGAPPHALDLTLIEFNLLLHLLRHPHRVFSRMDLIDACMPESDAQERTVDSHIAHLRRKLASCGTTAKISSVRGVGYKLVGPT